MRLNILVTYSINEWNLKNSLKVHISVIFLPTMKQWISLYYLHTNPKIIINESIIFRHIYILNTQVVSYLSLPKLTLNFNTRCAVIGFYGYLAPLIWGTLALCIIEISLACSIFLELHIKWVALLKQK